MSTVVLFGGFEANKGKFKGSSNVKFLSFKNGLSAIIDRLEEILG